MNFDKYTHLCRFSFLGVWPRVTQGATLWRSLCLGFHALEFTILKFLSSNLCFVNEVQWDSGLCWVEGLGAWTPTESHLSAPTPLTLTPTPSTSTPNLGARLVPRSQGRAWRHPSTFREWHVSISLIRTQVSSTTQHRSCTSLAGHPEWVAAHGKGRYLERGASVPVPWGNTTLNINKYINK